MTTAEKYVTAAFLVVLAVVLLYVVIYSFKIVRLEREVDELADLTAKRLERPGSEESAREPERVT